VGLYSTLASYPGLLTPAFVACNTNTGEGLVKLSHVVWRTWTCGGVAQTTLLHFARNYIILYCIMRHNFSPTRSVTLEQYTIMESSPASFVFSKLR